MIAAGMGIGLGTAWESFVELFLTFPSSDVVQNCLEKTTGPNHLQIQYTGGSNSHNVMQYEYSNWHAP